MNKPLEPRLFVAVPLPAEVKERLARRCAELKKRWDFSKWVHREDYHLTVQFLGNCSGDQIERITEELARLSAHHAPFALRVTGAGTFGRSEQPRILWAGVGGDLKALHALERQVVQRLAAVGFPPENRPYRPHVTVARKCLVSGFPPNPEEEIRWGEEAERPWTADELILYETRLGTLPMYTPVRRFPLGGKA